MNPGSILRGAAPVVGIAAATTVAAAAASYASVRWAGEADGGTAAQLVGHLGGMAVAAGGLVGIAAGTVASRVGAHGLSGNRAAALIPIGIAGAALGGWLARRGLEQRHPEEYATQNQMIVDSVTAAQAMFRVAGAEEATLDRVPERYDRSYFNASYQLPLGPLRNDMVIGRSASGGAPLGTLDVIAHEFAHKVVHEHAPLLGRSFGGDALAIHESLADTFAMAVDIDDWLVGEDARPGGVRSFSHPELLGSVEPDGTVLAAPITKEQLAGGAEAHLGAGVGNKAAWRIGEALGRPEMARIYVAALERGELGFRSGYDDLARAVRGAAIELHGAGSREAQVVDESWTRAGY